MSEHITVEVANRVMTIRFSRPDKKNAITHAMYAAIVDAMVKAEADPGIRAILFEGDGDCFTAGNDLIDFQQNPPIEPDTPVMRFLAALATAETPLIAAVHGATVGVGLTMLLHCDLVFAGESALLSVPFIDLALVPEAASSLLLPRVVGKAMAADMFFTGRRLTAEESLKAGLVSRIYPDDQLKAEARAAAEKLAAKPPQAVREARKLIRPDVDEISERMRVEGALFGAQLKSPEFMEAAMAFMQRRAPNFD